ncbi:hypothetical protein NQ315_000965 [Exocentrus adspersus]|uniref:RING-type E3 ubiquitin transferase n=1 Tax=Exocentrus adspersus TaxID=1586481 RepID=A0AAV8WEE5_9CUCU|nr:hypothetical protein NQ315_000965 [Exocentrus adspersus]
MKSNQLTKLLEFFECPVCCCYILSPCIFQCVQGHIICDCCDQRTTNCPICRGQKLGRASDLEVFRSKLLFPCENSCNGCGFKSVPREVESHQSTCQFAESACPLNFGFTCKWLGTVKDLVGHFKEKHQDRLFFGRVSIVIIPRGEEFGLKSALLVCAFNRLFSIKYQFEKLKSNDDGTAFVELHVGVSVYPVPVGKNFEYTVHLLSNPKGHCTELFDMDNRNDDFFSSKTHVYGRRCLYHRCTRYERFYLEELKWKQQQNPRFTEEISFAVELSDSV